MKPMIIYIKKDGNLDLTPEKLEKLISDAFQQGYDEGFYAGTKVNTFTYPEVPTWNKTIRYDQVTCDTNTGFKQQGAGTSFTTSQSAASSVETASEP